MRIMLFCICLISSFMIFFLLSFASFICAKIKHQLRYSLIFDSNSSFLVFGNTGSLFSDKIAYCSGKSLLFKEKKLCTVFSPLLKKVQAVTTFLMPEQPGYEC